MLLLLLMMMMATQADPTYDVRYADGNEDTLPISMLRLASSAWPTHGVCVVGGGCALPPRNARAHSIMSLVRVLLLINVGAG